MSSKYEDEPLGRQASAAEFFLPAFHDKYRFGHEGAIRREYMDHARGDFYGTIAKRIRIKRDGVVLDLGCGTGQDIVGFRQRGHQGHVYGLETPVPEDPAESEAKKEALIMTLEARKVDNFSIVLGYAEQLDRLFPAESLDGIWAANVLQEATDVDEALNQIYRTLKDDGLLVAVTNHARNKPLHHKILGDWARAIGGVPPLPHSAGFNSKTGPRIMARHAHQFRFEQEVIQEGKNNLPLDSPDSIESLLRSLSTYWYDIQPYIYPEWDVATKRQAVDDFYYRLRHQHQIAIRKTREDLMAKAMAGRPDADTVKRVAYLYRKRPTSGFVTRQFVKS